MKPTRFADFWIWLCISILFSMVLSGPSWNLIDKLGRRVNALEHAAAKSAAPPPYGTCTVGQLYILTAPEDISNNRMYKCVERDTWKLQIPATRGTK
jgi:hypothetical protein